MSSCSKEQVKRHLPRPLRSYLLLFAALCVSVPATVIVYESIAYSVRRRPANAYSDVSSMSMVVKLFYDHHGKLPLSLSELTNNVGNELPYIQVIPLDPWGNKYKYIIIDSNKYFISSDGPDEVPSTDDDIKQKVPSG